MAKALIRLLLATIHEVITIATIWRMDMQRLAKGCPVLDRSRQGDESETLTLLLETVYQG